MRHFRYHYILFVLFILLFFSQCNKKAQLEMQSKFQDATFSISYDFNKSELLIIQHLGAKQEIWDCIPFDIVNIYGTQVITKNNVFLVGKDNSVLKYTISEKQLERTKIPCFGMFSLSKDEKIICTTVMLDVQSDSSDIDTQILFGEEYSQKQVFPALFDLTNGELIQEYYFQYIEHEKGIGINIDFDMTNNGFKISYHWDNLSPVYVCFINLNDYSFISLYEKEKPIIY